MLGSKRLLSEEEEKRLREEGTRLLSTEHLSVERSSEYSSKIRRMQGTYNLPRNITQIAERLGRVK